MALDLSHNCFYKALQLEHVTDCLSHTEVNGVIECIDFTPNKQSSELAVQLNHKTQPRLR